MSTIQEEARAKLGLDTSEWEAKLKGAQTLTDNFFRRISNVATFGMGAFGIREIANFFTGMLQESAALKRTSENLGFTVEGMQAFRKMAYNIGSDEEVAAQHAAKMAEKIGSALSGDAAAVKWFNTLGISIKNAGGDVRTTEEIFMDFMDRLAAIPSEAERAALAQDLLGRSGQAMATEIAKGSQAFRDLKNDVALTSGEIERYAKIQGEIRQTQDTVKDFGMSLFDSFYRGVSVMTREFAMLFYGKSQFKTYLEEEGFSIPEEGLSAKPLPVPEKVATGLTAEEKKKLKEMQAANLQKRISGEDDEKKKVLIEAEINKLQKDRASYSVKDFQYKKLTEDIESKRIDVNNILIKQEAEKARLTEQQAELKKSELKSAEDLAYRQTDRYHFTLEDVASWKGGNRWRQQSGMRARAVQQLEAASRNQASMGYGWNADALMQRADYIRGTISALKSDERAPFADAAQSLNEISAKLDVLERKLTPTGP